MCNIHIITENEKCQNEYFWIKELQFKAKENMFKIFVPENAITMGPSCAIDREQNQNQQRA
jgi:hypothetical protein